MDKPRKWKRDISFKENEFFLNLFASFAGERIEYGTYSFKFHRGLLVDVTYNISKVVTVKETLLPKNKSINNNTQKADNE